MFYTYDHLSQSWEVYVDQINAITSTSRWQGSSGPNNGKFTQPIVVMGPYITSLIDGSPLTLEDAFANLPDSSTLGLDGIAEVNGKLCLFRHGRYVIADTTTPTNTVGQPIVLTSLAGWPTTTPPWRAGSRRSARASMPRLWALFICSATARCWSWISLRIRLTSAFHMLDKRKDHERVLRSCSR